MEYQQYDWNFNQSAAPPVDTSSTITATDTSSIVPTVTKCTTSTT